MTKSPFHEGERAVQSRAGVREVAERIGGRMVASSMAGVFRALFEELPYVVVAAVGPDGAPHASMLVGRPGFVSSPDDRTLVIDAAVPSGDPIHEGLTAGAPVGLLGIQLETRRRTRANGVVLERSGARLVIRVQESFGNCPQYIQSREILDVTSRKAPTAIDEHAILSKRALEIVARADTTFIASVSAGRRVDVSHRGGRRGFVRSALEAEHTVLTMPDFSGNNLFMTLGNLAEDPRAGLAIVDFESGALLSLTGTTSLVWDGPELASFAGAERLVRFAVTGGRLLEGAIPFAWSAPRFARQLP
jgi:predicted pyridoxine 5'-phosphate oxidase superfamily flavin-nucleotide-binding protein